MMFTVLICSLRKKNGRSVLTIFLIYTIVYTFVKRLMFQEVFTHHNGVVGKESLIVENPVIKDTPKYPKLSYSKSFFIRN